MQAFLSHSRIKESICNAPSRCNVDLYNVSDKKKNIPLKHASAQIIYPAEAFAKGGDDEEHLIRCVFVSTCILLDCSNCHKGPLSRHISDFVHEGFDHIKGRVQVSV